MSCEFTSLLPRSTEAMLALEQEANEKYCRADPEIIKQLHDPELCPIEFLPWLAYALSVDVWNDGWPEATKRAVCANAITAHIHKGTRGGLEDIMQALGVRLEVVEWFEMQPQGEPGTVDLTLWINQNINPSAAVIVGADLISDLNKVIATNKRASIHHTLTLAVEMKTGLKVAYSAQGITTLTKLDAKQTTVEINPTPTRLVAGYSAQGISTLTKLDAKQTTVEINPSPTRLVAGYSAQGITTLTKIGMTL